MNKSLFLIVCLIGYLIPTTGQRAIVDQVAATIGSEIVLLSEIEERMAQMAGQGENVTEETRCLISEQLLANKLMINQARLDSIIVEDVEVQAQLDARIERILSYMNGSTEQFEAFYGQTVDEVREQFRQDLKEQLLMEKMRGQIMQNVRVTPSEVKEFFDQIPTDSLPYFNSEVEIGEIVAKPTVNEAEKERVRSFLADLRGQILDSIVTFEAMAERYSEDGSARLGGDLGWSTRGKFVPEFEAAAYKLELYDISEPVESQFGFHLIQMTGRRGNSIKVRHILIKPEISTDDLQKTERYLDSVRRVIIKDTLNFSNAVKQFSDEDQQSYNNDGRMQNPATGNTFFEVGDLNPDIFFAIDTLEVGQISAPFEFRGPTGDIYYRIVQLQSRTAPHTANLQEDYSKIRQAAIDSKRNQFINEWIGDKIDRTFIQIDSRLDGCPNLQKWKRDRTVIRP